MSIQKEEINTEGGFSTDRVKQIIPEENKEEMKNILLLKPTTFEEQKKEFEKLLKQIKTNNIALIIVDGMTMLYRLELGDAIQNKQEDKIQNVNRELAKQLRTLAEISRKQNIPIIATNQVYYKFGKEEANMVGGDLLKYWSKCIIELTNERGKKKLILRKHRSLPENELSFIITNSGIKKRGWI